MVTSVAQPCGVSGRDSTMDDRRRLSWCENWRDASRREARVVDALVVAVVERLVRVSAEIWTRRRDDRRRRDGPRAVVSDVPYTRWRYSSAVSSSGMLLKALGRFWLVLLLVVVCGTSCVLCRGFFVGRHRLPLFARSPSSVGSPAVGSIAGGCFSFDKVAPPGTPPLLK